MAIADKLTYLNTTKVLLREAINRAGHYLTEADPFREYPYALLKDEHSLQLDFLRGEYIAKNRRDGTVSRVGFDNIITFTRGSGGGRFNHLGVYEWVGSNVARIDHDPATVDTSASSVVIGAGIKTFAVSRLYPVGQYVRATADASNWVSGRVVASTGSSVTLWVDRVVGTGTFASWTLIRVLGLLVEESRTNLARNSANLTAREHWTVDNGTLPTADSYRETVASGIHRVFSPTVSLAPATTYTSKVFFKPVGRRYFAIRVPIAGNQNFCFDAQLGVTTYIGTRVTGGIKVLPSGAVEAWATFTTEGSATLGSHLVVSDTPILDNNVPTYAGDVNCGFDNFRAQLEAGAFPTSHIPTTSSQVTRAADVASVNELSPWYNASEGAMVADVVRLSTANSSLYQLVNNGSNRLWVRAQITGLREQFVSVVGDVNQAVFTPVAVLQHKSAFAYKENDFAVSLNGGAAQVDGSGAVPSGVTQLHVGHNAAANFLNGHIRSLQYFPRRLSNDELQRLTS